MKNVLFFCSGVIILYCGLIVTIVINALVIPNRK